MKSLTFPTLVTFFIVVSTLSSCSKFFDGVVQEIEFPEHTPRIVPTLIVNDEAERIIALVSSSASTLDSEGPQVIEDAVLTISNESEILYSMDENNLFDGLYILELDDKLGMLEGPITLRVESPSFDEVSSTSTMPDKPVYTVDFQESADTINNVWGFDILDRYTFNIETTSPSSKHFIIKFYMKYIDLYTEEISDWETMYTYPSFDPRITLNYFINGVMIYEESNSSSATSLNDLAINIQRYSEYFTIVERKVVVEAISDDLFKYYMSLERIASVDFQLFSEPTLSYSNVSGGFGCFGLGSVTETIIE
ncbi:MAG TPA: DUF4249 family protein [Flavobacteriales bacterium]|jgi:hypothetical protein|nr:DUF4249 family protein [Flavobacteriales bacterium]HIO16799.1 DUF4249 family protein [Flavobacteriales bacterium]